MNVAYANQNLLQRDIFEFIKKESMKESDVNFHVGNVERNSHQKVNFIDTKGLNMMVLGMSVRFVAYKLLQRHTFVDTNNQNTICQPMDTKPLSDSTTHAQYYTLQKSLHFTINKIWLV